MKYLHVKYRFDSEDEKRGMIEACEHNFAKQIDVLSSAVSDSDSLRAITLCGPTCSGKTTICNRLTETLSEAGKNVRLISIDDFFKDRAELNREAIDLNVEIDYDSPQSLDLSCLQKCVEDIGNLKSVAIPVYDFRTGTRQGYREMDIGEGDIILFEGIQALYPEFRSLLNGMNTLSVFASVENGYNAGGEKFTPREIRLVRRIVRDYRFRSAPPAFTFYLWKSVSENEEKNIFPYVDSADVRINTELSYELSAIKNDIMAVLSLVPNDSEYHHAAEALAGKFKNIESVPIEYIPKNSFFREFIG